MRESKRRRMASLDAMDVATRFVNAANQHDADGLISCAHRDFQSIQPVHPERSFRGVAQLRNNWEAIFRTEPGFRLTVLRSTATDDTVWMEVHGAGDDEEAAGMFIFGVDQGRIRWIRVYSDIVEPVPEPAAESTEPIETATATEPVLAAVPDPEAADAGPDGATSDGSDGVSEDGASEDGDSDEAGSDADEPAGSADLWDAVVVDSNEASPALDAGNEAPPQADDPPAASSDEEAPPRKGWRRVLRAKA